jgi:3-hydroxyacyl-CoA dehydrogenase
MSGIDVVMDILKLLKAARPDSSFVESLYQQYCNRGGLSRKQLEGLYSKAEKLPEIPTGRLATLQAIINKKPIRHRNDKTLNLPVTTVDETIPALIDEILMKYPSHKRVLFLQQKHKQREPFLQNEKDEILRFAKLLLGKK